MDKHEFMTLRGFLSGEEDDMEPYFAFSATLRIFGNIPDPDEISETLGLSPTNAYRKGERKGPHSPPFLQDMWSYRAPVPEEKPLGTHIEYLWSKLKDHKSYLLDLKKRLAVDVFLGYRSNIDFAGFEIPHTSLEIFTELEIPFGVSIVVA